MESQLIGFIMASLLIILLVILRKSDMVSFLKEHPNLPQQIEEELFRLKNNPKRVIKEQGGLIRESIEISWKSETGYPDEGYLENVFLIFLKSLVDRI